jgi:hypothetical protein
MLKILKGRLCRQLENRDTLVARMDKSDVREYSNEQNRQITDVVLLVWQERHASMGSPRAKLV